MSLNRRTVLGALALPPLAGLAGCSTPLPLTRDVADDPAAQALLVDSAQAHGLAACRRLNDINVAYDGQWYPLIDRLQPEVVDAGFRQRSQERLMPALGLVAQAHAGPKGRKQVWWQRGSGRDGDLGSARVWLDGQESPDLRTRQAAALVAEGYGLFLLGPLWLVDRGLPATWTSRETVDGRECDVVTLWLTPGLGQVARDRVALCIDRRDRLTRRMRITLEGFERTRGAVAEVDTFDHERRFGVVWPMRFLERVVHPVAMPAHRWRITGLDVDRGYGPQALAGPAFSLGAQAPARAL